MKRKLLFLGICILIRWVGAAQPASGTAATTLNGLHFIFDAESGGILSLSHPATGIIVQTSRDSAGLLDIAYPVTEFEPLRLAARFSRNAQIAKTDSSVVIHWDALGASRSFVKYQGKVSATVTIKRDSDGKSVRLSCFVENKSDHSIPQIVFPDFFGIVPFCGTQGTEFRTGGTVIKPFIDMQVPKHDNFYAINESTQWYHHGFVLNGRNLVMKWMDIGGRKGGLSIFSRDWGINKGYDEGVFLKLSEQTQKLRYMKTVFSDIAPGGTWQSPEYTLTPHANGWAAGIEPYREWANQHIRRLYPLPDHVRDGLGYQTLWMRNFFYPEDPEGNNFTYKDLTKVANEAKENGLDELVLWGWNYPFTLPLPPSNKFVGTDEELVEAVAACKRIGVNVSPFRSVMIANPGTAKKYGEGEPTEYNYDPDFLPILNPRYAKNGKGAVMVPSSNKLWQQEVLSSTKRLIKMGIPSVCWDQFFTVGPGKYLDTIVTEIINTAKEKDPQSTFSAEAGTNMENECDYLDYTWNWDYKDNADYSALINALKGPRININIDRSVEEAKIGFANNLYLNVYPRKPDGVNGSDYISNHPELSAALKQCARLRKQFLNYFVNGIFIGDCILTKDCPGAHISTYVLPKSVLVVVINQKNKKAVDFKADLPPWLSSAAGKYEIKQYRDGLFVNKSTIVGGKWVQKTPMMNPLDIHLYEVIAVQKD